MQIRGGVASVLVLLLLAIAAGCSKPEAPKPAAPTPAVSAAAEGKALFEQKCGVCHGLGRATVRKESKDRWIEVVREMQGKKGDWISDADAAKIVEFLASEHGK
ncbi:MAG TPA: cytochrome c [Candidatus Limnocylindrales bacterium]|nr:cytochrome c [Candidatus Limnocylindrales bacterium]